MNLAGSTALVTGTNRGFGRHLARELLDRGAVVYAGARHPETVDLPGAIPSSPAAASAWLACTSPTWTPT